MCIRDSYHAVPEAGGDKAYELLRKAMLSEEKVAIAKTVIGQTEKLLALIPTDTGILVETLFFYDEIKEMPKEPEQPELNDAELTMAKTLVNSMVTVSYTHLDVYKRQVLRFLLLQPYEKA